MESSYNVYEFKSIDHKHYIVGSGKGYAFRCKCLNLSYTTTPPPSREKWYYNITGFYLQAHKEESMICLTSISHLGHW